MLWDVDESFSFFTAYFHRYLLYFHLIKDHKVSQSQKKGSWLWKFFKMIVKVKKWLFFLQNLFSVINFGSFFYNYIQLQKGLSASCSLFRNKKFDVLYKGSSLGYEQIQNWVRTTILIVKVFIFTWTSSDLMKNAFDDVILCRGVSKLCCFYCQVFQPICHLSINHNRFRIVL